MQFIGLGLEQWLGIASAVVAVSSFVLNLRLVRRQEKRNAANFKMAHDSDIIRWSDEVISVLAEADEMLRERGVSYGDAEFAARRSASRAHVSALIDRGRLFFPNRTDTQHGVEKEAGFQGYRQPALEELFQAYRVIDTAATTPGPDKISADALMKHRRKFIAEVFQTVDPVRRGATLQELAA
ncbi:MAG: hypothetical protein Q8R02_01095 [Hyphomonadaceae bacterium]|nr:hypothetical protein [Hyphomonadaceae bacterium]